MHLSICLGKCNSYSPFQTKTGIFNSWKRFQLVSLNNQLLHKLTWTEGNKMLAKYRKQKCHVSIFIDYFWQKKIVKYIPLPYMTKWSDFQRNIYLKFIFTWKLFKMLIELIWLTVVLFEIENSSSKREKIKRNLIGGMRTKTLECHQVICYKYSITVQFCQ